MPTNTPTPITRQVTNKNPPISTLNYKTDVHGLKYKRFPSAYWGNVVYETSNGMGFDDYYTAITVQKLLNVGYSEKKIRKYVPINPIYFQTKNNQSNKKENILLSSTKYRVLSNQLNRQIPEKYNYIGQYHFK